AGAADEKRGSRRVLRGVSRRAGTQVERPLVSPHEIRNPQTLPHPSGFSHAVIAQAGRTVYLAGQTAQRADGTVTGATMAEQFDVAAGNVVKRSEEHTSELQSRENLVCRLLLEKKKSHSQ